MGSTQPCQAHSGHTINAGHRYYYKPLRSGEGMLMTPLPQEKRFSASLVPTSGRGKEAL